MGDVQIEGNAGDSDMRCAIYTRVLTNEQALSEYSSLKRQEEICRNYIDIQAEKGWKVAVYEDAGYSGKDFERPALQTPCVGKISIPCSAAAASSFGTSGAAGGGRVGAAAGSPTVAAKRSKPAGEVSWSARTGRSPSTVNRWGIPRGRNAKSPGPIVQLRSPQVTRNAPSRT
jgi:hypothetical protein